MLSFLTPITVFPCRLKLCSMRKYIKWANGEKAKLYNTITHTKSKNNLLKERNDKQLIQP